MIDKANQNYVISNIEIRKKTNKTISLVSHEFPNRIFNMHENLYISGFVFQPDDQSNPHRNPKLVLFTLASIMKRS